MVYLSEATGEMGIATNSLDALEELKNCFKITKNWWNDISCIDIKDKKVIEYPAPWPPYIYYRYNIACKFKGTGEGSFPTTLKTFQHWLEKDIFPNNQLLQNSDFYITFNYLDQSSKQNFINSLYTGLIHASGEITIKNQSVYSSVNSYSLVNKAKYTGVSLNKVISNEFEYKNSSNIVSILYNEKREIEKYTGKLLEVYLYENGLGEYAEMYNEFITD